MEQPAARSRRPHTKSRLGCQQCKARRIKCDQAYPTCGHCYRTQKPCSLRSTGPTGPGAPGSDLGGSPTGLDHYDAMDVYLMHVFTLETADTLTLSPTVRTVWRQAMPRRAIEQPMLMHGLLSIAGLHRYFVATDNDHEKQLMLSRSASHQSRGIELYRAQIAETGGSNARRDVEQTCVAFAAMLLTVTMGQIKAAPTPTAIDDIFSVLDHMRSIGALLSTASNKVDSDIAPMFGMTLTEELPFTLDCGDILETLHDLSTTTADPVLLQTTQILQGVLSAPITCTVEFYLLGSFAVTITEEYYTMVRSRDVTALKIFHEYCKSLRPLYSLWYFEDWADIVGRELDSMTNGHEPHTLKSNMP